MKLKQIAAFCLLVVFAASLTNCKASASASVGTKSTRTNSKPLPPGQAKKMNGDKSAKKYAPGHN